VALQLTGSPHPVERAASSCPVTGERYTIVCELILLLPSVFVNNLSWSLIKIILVNAI
jgi:hypothetical protein